MLYSLSYGRVAAVYRVGTPRASAGLRACSELAHAAGPYLRIGGSPALIAETPSTPAILQIGCEKSFARLGVATIP